MEDQNNFIVLNDKFTNIMPNIKFRFTYRSIIIDLLDCFPFLKEGKQMAKTICNIIVAHKWFIAKKCSDNINDIDIDNINDIISDHISVVKCNNELIENMRSEEILSKQLCNVIIHWHQCSNKTKNELIQFLICCSQTSKDLHNKLIESNDYIRLMWNIIENNLTEVSLMLFVEELDPRIGNNDLYQLALLCEECNIKELLQYTVSEIKSIFSLKLNILFDYIEEYNQYSSFIDFLDTKHHYDVWVTNFIKFKSIQNSNISKHIKETSIKRNWMEKQIIIKNIGESQSTTSDDIFNYLNNFR